MPEGTETQGATAVAEATGSSSTPTAAASASTAQHGQSIDTDSQPAGGSGASVPVSLDELLKQHPGLKEQIDQRFVSPATKNARNIARTELRDEVTNELRTQLAQQDYERRASGLLERAEKGDEDALKELGRLQAQQLRQSQGARARETERQTLQRELALDMIKNVFGIETTDIPVGARANYDALREWALQQSPHVQKMVQVALTTAKGDASTVEAAVDAAKFGEMVAATPNISTGVGGAGAVQTTAPLSDAEWQRNRANTEWRNQNKVRIREAFRGGKIR